MLTQTEINRIENNPVLTNRLLFAWTSMIAAGAVIVVWQSAKYLFSYDFNWFLLISFLDIAVAASIFVYIRAKQNRVLQVYSTFLLTPIFIIVFMLATTFMSEMFYGGSGYHGEYLFPFLQRTNY